VNSVCQDGVFSGMVCNIKVVHHDVSFFDPSEGITHQGVEGTTPGPPAGQPGDSGGLVFAIAGSTSAPRQVRGIVSGGIDDFPSILFWTQAPDILSSLKLQLAP
jgi:hypothetical protein